MLLRFVIPLMFVAANAAAQTFEGSVSMTVTDDDGKTTPVTYLSKGGKIRFDMSEGGVKQGGIVIDPVSQKMLIIIEEAKMYMEMPMPQPAAPGRVGQGTGRSGGRMGGTETIAGHQCRHVITTDDDGASVDSCVTTELGTFRMFASGSQMQPPQEEGWTAGLPPGSFPLKAMKGDKVLLQVTQIQAQSLDAALFAPPAGYRKFNMGGRGGSTR